MVVERVLSRSKKAWTVQVDGRKIKVWPGQFGKPTPLSFKQKCAMKGHAVIADYRYVVTAHKAQGSEWDFVVVIDQEGPWDQTRWLYTAVTRAAERVRLLHGAM